MPIYQELPTGLPKTTAAYWKVMQLAILEFSTARPINSWLIRIGVKEKM